MKISLLLLSSAPRTGDFMLIPPKEKGWGRPCSCIAVQRDRVILDQFPESLYLGGVTGDLLIVSPPIDESSEADQQPVAEAAGVRSQFTQIAIRVLAQFLLAGPGSGQNVTQFFLQGVSGQYGPADQARPAQWVAADIV